MRKRYSPEARYPQTLINPLRPLPIPRPLRLLLKPLSLKKQGPWMVWPIRRTLRPWRSLVSTSSRGVNTRQWFCRKGYQIRSEEHSRENSYETRNHWLPRENTPRSRDVLPWESPTPEFLLPPCRTVSCLQTWLACPCQASARCAQTTATR